MERAVNTSSRPSRALNVSYTRQAVPSTSSRCIAQRVGRSVRQRRCHSIISAAASPASVPEQPSGGTPIFPRLRERDPYRVLGISKEADFEEVVSARNFLFETYRHHERSREHVEAAYEKIMSEKYEWRKKHGFKPVRRSGQKGSDFEAPPSLWQRFVGLFDKSVTKPTIVNEGAIFGAMAAWAYLAYADAQVPWLGAILYSVYRFIRKRQLRSPEGPFLGGTPFFGAVLTTFIGLGIGIVTSDLVGKVLPFEMAIRSGIAAAVVPVIMGLINIFVK